MLLRDSLPSIKTALPGPNAAKVLERRKAATPAAIGTVYPCVIKRGEGAMVEDVDGNIFLDWVGGVGVLNIGYSVPELVEAVQEQAGKYFHAMFNIITHEGYVALAEKINSFMPVRGDVRQTMFANSGAEADENAVKIAKAYTGRPNVIAFSGAFHGRTLLTMALTSKKAYAVGMGPFPDGIYRAPFPNLYRKPDLLMSDDEAMEWYLQRFNDIFEECSPSQYIAAVILEPVQGEGGFVPMPLPYMKALRKICDEKGILIIADEVQSGWGRSGRMFASEYWKDEGCAPDIISTAKSIAGGVPLSAVCARKEIFDKVGKGVIGGTFCGNALGCAAALKLIKVMERDNLPGSAAVIGEHVRSTVESWKSELPVIGDVRGMGSMLGIEFVLDEKLTPATALVSKIVQAAVHRGLIIENAGTYGNVIRFLCPLTATDAQVDAGLEILKESIKVSM